MSTVYQRRDDDNPRAKSAFRRGDPEPQGYAAWHEWAEVQYRSGLRQAWCPRCRKWKFPQQQHCDAEARQP